MTAIKKKNILHVMSRFNEPSQTFVINTIKLLAKENTNFLLATYSRENAKISFEESHVCRENIAWEQGSNFRSFTDLKKIILDPCNFLKLLSTKLKRKLGYEKKEVLGFLESAKPDLIIFHFGWAFYEYEYILKNTKIPIVISLHGSDVTNYAQRNPLYIDRLKEVSLLSNVMITACSSYLRELVVDYGVKSRSVVTLYNTYRRGTNRNKFKEFSPQNGIKIVNVGRMIKLKGHRVLLDAFDVFLKSNRGTLTLIGGGEDFEEIKQYAHALGIAEHVVFLGEVLHEQVLDILKKQDIYVQPSIVDPVSGGAESFGVVLLEALDAGLPVIASNIGGIPEVLEDKEYRNISYFLTPPGDFLSLSKSIESLCRGYDIDKNEQYSKQRLPNFSEEKYILNLSEIFNKIQEKI